jgi:hypothetical protein
MSSSSYNSPLQENEAGPVLSVDIAGDESQVTTTIHALEHGDTTIGVGTSNQELVRASFDAAKSHTTDLLQPRRNLSNQLQGATSRRLLPLPERGDHSPSSSNGGSHGVLAASACGVISGIGAVDELEDGDRVTLIKDVFPDVAVGDIDQGVGELVGGSRDEDLGSGEFGTVDGSLGRVDGGDVGDERQGCAVGALGNLLGGQGRGGFVHSEEDVACKTGSRSAHGIERRQRCNLPIMAM